MTETGPPIPPWPTIGPGATFHGFIAGSTLTVTAAASGTLGVGMTLFDQTGYLLEDTRIVGFGTGSGVVGTYTVNRPQTFFAQDMTAQSLLFDWWDTIISQFANSPILIGLIQKLDGYIDQKANLDAFYDNIWNIATARGIGLDIWGRIVGVSRVITGVAANEWFGFVEAYPGSYPFNQGTFYSNGPTLTSNFTLADDPFRLLILAKAASNITNGSIPSINTILMNLFPGRGNCFVTEPLVTTSYFGFSTVAYLPFFGFGESGTAQPFNNGGDFYNGSDPLVQTIKTGAQPFNQAQFWAGVKPPQMTMTYTFDFPLSPVELAIVSNGAVLPKPSGVVASVVVN